MIDQKTFIENRNRFPAEELEKYVGQYVAWSEDGTRILMADPVPDAVYRMLREAGYDTGAILVTFVDDPGVRQLGWHSYFGEPEE